MLVMVWFTIRHYGVIRLIQCIAVTSAVTVVNNLYIESVFLYNPLLSTHTVTMLVLHGVHGPELPPWVSLSLLYYTSGHK